MFSLLLTKVLATVTISICILAYYKQKPAKYVIQQIISVKNFSISTKDVKG